MAKRVLSILIVLFLLFGASSCDRKMTAEEIEAACKKEAKNFVGGYLSCSSTYFLKKYTADPEEDLEMHKLKKTYGGRQEFGIADRIADYILTHATFEIDPYSYVYDKSLKKAELRVNVTIIPPETAFDTIEHYVTTLYSIQAGDTAAVDAAYREAESMVRKISPVTKGVDMTFSEKNGEWLIDDYWMVMIGINEAK